MTSPASTSSDSDTIKGSCLCGAHTIDVSSSAWEGARPCVCHCTSCRKMTGSLFSLATSLSSFALTSKSARLVQYTDTSCDSGNKLVRTFCGTCGSPISGWVMGRENELQISLGLFPPHTLPPPAYELYTKNLEAWEISFPNARQSEGMYGGEESAERAAEKEEKKKEQKKEQKKEGD